MSAPEYYDGHVKSFVNAQLAHPDRTYLLSTVGPLWRALQRREPGERTRAVERALVECARDERRRAKVREEAWERLARSVMCGHSYFAPRRGERCPGCCLRESQRALGMLLDCLEPDHDFSRPVHGLEVSDAADARLKARQLYEMVEEAIGR